MKGQSLPTNMIILVAIGVVAIGAIGAFLLSGSFGNLTASQAQKTFSTGCARYCSTDIYQTFANAYAASQSDPDFANACVELGYIKENEKQYLNRCLSKCGNCNLEITENDGLSGFENIDAQFDRR